MVSRRKPPKLIIHQIQLTVIQALQITFFERRLHLYQCEFMNYLTRLVIEVMKMTVEIPGRAAADD